MKQTASVTVLIVALFLTPAVAKDEVIVGGIATEEYKTTPIEFDHCDVYIDIAYSSGNGILIVSDSIIISIKKNSPLAKRLIELGKEATK